MLINGKRCFELDMVSLCHQRKPLLRLSPESITVVQPAGPDDQLKVRTRMMETLKQLINDVPISPQLWGWLGELGREYTQLEHEFGEGERCDG